MLVSSSFSRMGSSLPLGLVVQEFSRVDLQLS